MLWPVRFLSPENWLSSNFVLPIADLFDQNLLLTSSSIRYEVCYEEFSTTIESCL